MTLSVDIRPSLQYQDLLPGNYWDLDGTGFNLNLQIEKLLTEARERPFSFAIDNWAFQTDEDIRSFWLEYLCQRLVLPIKLKKIDTENGAEIIAPNYGNQPLLETVSEKERNGTVKASLAKIVEYLKTASPGSTSILISPSGWSGLHISGGKEIVYEESQIYFYQVGVLGNIEAVTFRTDCSLIENQTIAYILNPGGFSIREGDEKEVIEAVVSAPIFIDSTNFRLGINEFVEVLRKIKKSRFVLRDKTFEDLENDLNKVNQIIKADKVTEEMIESFHDFVLNEVKDLSPQTTQTIRKRLGETILKISANKRSLETGAALPDQIDFLAELKNLRMMGGCNGGGQGNGSFLINHIFGIRSVSSQEAKKRVHCGKCGKFGEFKEGEFCTG